MRRTRTRSRACWSESISAVPAPWAYRWVTMSPDTSWSKRRSCMTEADCARPPRRGSSPLGVRLRSTCGVFRHLLDHLRTLEIGAYNDIIPVSVSLARVPGVSFCGPRRPRAMCIGVRQFHRLRLGSSFWGACRDSCPSSAASTMPIRKTRFDVSTRNMHISRVRVLQSLARHVSRIELAGEAERRFNNMLRGLERLPFRLVPACDAHGNADLPDSGFAPA